MKAKSILIILFCGLGVLECSGQVFYHINEQWNTQNTTINNLDYVDSDSDSNSGIITVGSEIVSNEGANALIQYVDNQGNLLWDLSFNSQGNADDYATAVFVDAQDTIHVCGVSFDPVSLDYDFLVLKVSPSGQITSSNLFDYSNGLNNYASDIVVRNGSVYVTGTVENSATDYDMLTLGINSSGQQIWSTTFGASSDFDIGSSISLLATGIIVSGGSGQSFESWQFSTVKYNFSGVEIASVFSANGVSQFSSPSSVITHEDGTVTILGQVETSPNNSDILLLKLDEDLSTIWETTYDFQGLNDAGTSMALDQNSNYVVSGWLTSTTGQKKLALIKFNDAGVLTWSKSLTFGTGVSEDLRGMAIDVHSNEMFVAGVIESEAGKGLAVYKMKSNGDVVWSYNGELSNDFKVSGIEVTDSNTVKVSGLSHENGFSKYLSLELKAFARELIADTSSGIAHAKDQVIVKFDPQYLDSTFIYNSSKIYGFLDEILTPTGLTKLENCLGRSMKDYTGVKVYKNLTPLNQWSLTRQGDTIPIPKFWTSIVVLLDSSFDLDSVLISVKSCDEVAYYAQKNLMYEKADCSTSEYLDSIEEDDYGWWLAQHDNDFDNQISITSSIHISSTLMNQNDSDVDQILDGNIQCVPAWCFSVGRNDIIIGIIDDQIDFMHEDLRDEENGYIISGWDFFQNTVLNEESLIGAEWHGTRVAGVIGALRNNGKGVCGIAGGDYRAIENYWLENDDPNAPLQTLVQKGVQMNAYKAGQGITIFSEQAAEALLLSVTNDFEQQWGDACHILNNSWATTSDGLAYPWRLMSDYDFEIAKNYWFANRNGVSNFTARGNKIGNTSDRVTYPACFYDHWLISCGSSRASGNQGPSSLSDFNLDLLGPETDSELLDGFNVWTTTLDQGQSQIYTTFGGTSSGTPHVAGVASLMLSYFNGVGESENNLYPSDVENVLQMSAKNYVDAGGYTIEEGWGVVKAIDAIELLESPNFLLQHFEQSFDQSDLQLVENGAYLYIPTVEADGYGLSEGIYLVDHYQIEEEVNFSIPNDYIPSGAWALPESTNGFLDTQFLSGQEYLFLDHFSEISDQANLSSGILSLKTDVYHILTDSEGGTVSQWFPSELMYEIPYTVHFVHEQVQNISNIEFNPLYAYPNPVNDLLFLEISGVDMPFQAEIYNLHGQIVLSESKSAPIDISTLAKGVYIVQVIVNGQSYHTKIIKS